MGDFLSNLVTRSTAAAAAAAAEAGAVLRPRPVSIYESSQSAPGSPVEDKALDTAAVNLRPVPVSAPEGELLRDRPTPPVSSSEASLAWLENWRKRYLSQTDANQDLPAQPIQNWQAAAGSPRAPSLGPEPVQENHPVEPKARQVVQEMVMQPPLRSPTIAPSQPVAAVVRAGETSGSHRELPARTDGTGLKPIQTAGESATIRPVPVVSLPKPAEASVKQPPIIHVSIGRIEVRLNATSGQASTSPARRPAAVLSLEDYLRMRNGGGR